MAEHAALTVPITYPTTSTYRVDALVLHWDEQYIRIVLRTDDDRRIEHEYRGPTAVTLMVALNKANLSVKSLQRRILERLQADGVLGAGTIEGVPD